MALTDIGSAFRRLLANLGLTVGAATLLGIGIGLMTAMLAVVDALVLSPVPFPSPQELGLCYMRGPHGGQTTVAPEVLRAWRQCPAFVSAESANSADVTLEIGGSLVTRKMAWVTPGVFDMLGGVKPVLGRVFHRLDGAEVTQNSVILSERLWRGLYRADPAIIGARLTVDGEAVTVAGVLPSEFRFPAWDTVLWRPVDFGALPPTWAGFRPLVYVRLASGMPRSDALRLAAVAAEAADGANAALEARVQLLTEMLDDVNSRRAAALMSGAAVLVFLVLCANVAGLLLTHFSLRVREIATRMALGASNGKLIGDNCWDAGLLIAGGVLIGVAFGWVLLSIARVYLPETFFQHTLQPLQLHWKDLGVAACSGTVAAIIVGALPGLLIPRIVVSRSLAGAERNGTDARWVRTMMRVLLVVEIAFACTLLFGTAVLVRSSVKLVSAERGLQADGVISGTISLPSREFRGRAARGVATRALEDEIRKVPGVIAVVWSYGVPPNRAAMSFGRWVPDGAGALGVEMVVDRYQVGPDFFALYRIPVIRGRSVRPTDSDEEVVIGERLANALWPGLDPVGRSFTLEQNERFRVIGLARELSYPSVDPGVDRPEFYQLFREPGSTVMISMRCGQACPDPGTVHIRLARALPSAKIGDVVRLQERYNEQFARPHAMAAVGSAFTAIAVMASASGLFSMLSLAVGRRRRELAIRSAVGASPRQLGRLVLREIALLLLVGVCVGSCTAALLARSVAPLQYKVTMLDPLNWGIVVVVMAAVAMGASWVPAREAARAEPVKTLRLG